MRVHGSQAALLLALLLSFVAPAQAENLPERKPGLWTLTTVAETVGMKTFETCIGPRDSIVSGIGETGCTTDNIKRVDDETFVNVTCRSGNGRQLTSTLLSGDFSTWYRAVSKITFDPPQQGVSHLGSIVDGKFVRSTCASTEAR